MFWRIQALPRGTKQITSWQQQQEKDTIERNLRTSPRLRKETATQGITGLH